MAISLVGAPVAGSAGNGGNVTLTLPTMQEGDLVLILTCLPRGGSHVVSMVETGYTAASGTPFVNSSSAGNPSIGIFTKPMGATPDTSVTIIGSAGTADVTTAIAFCLRGVDTTTPLDTAVVSANTGLASADPPAITTVTAGAWVLAVGAVAVNDSAVTGLSGYSNFISVNQNDSRPITLAASTKQIASVGTENPPAYADLGPGTNPHGLTLAVRPAGATGGTTYDAAGTVAAAAATSAAALLLAVAGGTIPVVSGTSGETTALLSATGTTAATSGTSGAAEVVSGPSTYDASGTTAVTSGTTGEATAVLSAGGTTAATSGTSGQAELVSGPVTLDAGGTTAVVSGTSGEVAAVLGAAGTTAAVSDTSGTAVLVADPSNVRDVAAGQPLPLALRADEPYATLTAGPPQPPTLIAGRHQ